VVHIVLILVLSSISPGDSLYRDGLFSEAIPVLTQEAADDSFDAWIHYRLAWLLSKYEMPDSALTYAFRAWELQPDNQWFFGQYLKTLRELERYDEILDLSSLVTGGGSCRYYLAVAERETGTEPSISLEYFEAAYISEDDSISADAAVWLSILQRNQLSVDSICIILEKTVNSMPESDFYRVLYAETLIESGNIEDAVTQLDILHSLDRGYSYRQAQSALAEYEADSERLNWTLRRAYAVRPVPEVARSLGWQLFISGYEDLRNGRLELARKRLEDASQYGTTEVFAVESDSLLLLLDEFEQSSMSKRGRRRRS